MQKGATLFTEQPQAITVPLSALPPATTTQPPVVQPSNSTEESTTTVKLSFWKKLLQKLQWR